MKQFSNKMANNYMKGTFNPVKKSKSANYTHHTLPLYTQLIGHILSWFLMSVCVCECRCPLRPEEGIKFPGATAVGGCELPSVGA